MEYVLVLTNFTCHRQELLAASIATDRCSAPFVALREDELPVSGGVQITALEPPIGVSSDDPNALTMESVMQSVGASDIPITSRKREHRRVMTIGKQAMNDLNGLFDCLKLSIDALWLCVCVQSYQHILIQFSQWKRSKTPNLSLLWRRLILV
jgi:hypothetical protein